MVGADGRNSLARNFPEILEEWHPDNTVDPYAITAGGKRPVRWRCRAGHEWQDSPTNRTHNGVSCTRCRQWGRSQEEVTLAVELAQFLNIDPTRSERVEGWNREVDMVDHGRRLILEWDGSYWHAGQEARDRRKLDALTDAGWIVIRLREAPLEVIGPHDVVVPRGAGAHGRAAAALRAIERATGETFPGLEAFELALGPASRSDTPMRDVAA